MNIDYFLIKGTSSIKDALSKIDQNSYGIIFSQKKSGEVYGVATDGDIRRSYASNINFNESISKIMSLPALRI